MPPRHHRPARTRRQAVTRIAAHAKDAVLIGAIAWFGAHFVAMEVLGWKNHEPHSPILAGDAVVLLGYLVWVVGCAGVMAVARHRGRSGWGWFFIAYIVSPLIGGAA